MGRRKKKEERRRERTQEGCRWGEEGQSDSRLQGEAEMKEAGEERDEWTR